MTPFRSFVSIRLTVVVAASALAGCQLISKLNGGSSPAPSTNVQPTGGASAAEPAHVADRNAPVGDAPDWCAGYESDTSAAGVHKEMGYDKEGTNVDRAIEGSYDAPDGATRPGDWDRVGYKVAARACELPNDPMIRAQTAKWRKVYMTYWGLTARDFNDYMFAIKNGEEGLDFESWCGTVKHPKDDIEAGAANILCHKSQIESQLSGWNGGDLPNAPVVMSVANLPNDLDNKNRLGMEEGSMAWLPNLRDLNNLDRARLETEIKSLSVGKRVRIREHFRIAQRLKTAFDHYLTTLGPAQKKLLDAGLAAEKAWMATYAANKPEIDLAVTTLANVAAGKDVAGCGPKLRAAYAKALGGAQIASNKDLYVAINKPPLAALTRALSACLVAEGDVTAGLGMAAFVSRPPFEFTQGVSAGRQAEGPREATMDGAVAAYATLRPQPQLRFGDGWSLVGSHEPAPIRLPSGEAVMLTPETSMSNAGYGKGELYGTVQSIAKVGSFQRVTFKKEKTQYNELNCTTTNQITGIDDNGDFKYRSDCRYGKLITLDITFAPITVRPEHMAGIAPGRTVTFALYSIEKDPASREAFPLVVYADKKRSKPMVFLGAAISAARR